MLSYDVDECKPLVGGDVPALMATNPGLQRILCGAIGFPLSIFLVTTLGVVVQVDVMRTRVESAPGFSARN